MNHGTVSAYVNGHCRCDECRMAWVAYKPRQDASRRYHRKLRLAPILAFLIEQRDTSPYEAMRTAAVELLAHYDGDADASARVRAGWDCSPQHVRSGRRD